MIYSFIKEKLESVETLAEKVFPIGVLIDDMNIPAAVYQRKDRTPVRELSGEVHHYVETIGVDFLDESYDTVQELWWAARDVLEAVQNQSTGTGAYIFSIECASGEGDSVDMELELQRREMLVTVRWCPV